MSVDSIKKGDVLIEVKNLYKSFGENVVLDYISMEIKKGEVISVIGPSGCGKSTFIRSLNLLEEPTGGSIFFEGTDITERGVDIRQVREKIGMVFQQFNLFGNMTVKKNIMLAPVKLKIMTKAEAEKKAMELLEMVGLADKADQYPSQLSGGQKQRVAIARALASDPRILLCDEATSALDPQTTQQILDLLRKINEDTGITIIIITHQMSVVRDICNHVAIIEDGVLVEDGLVEDIFNHPKSRAGRYLVVEGKDPDEWERARLEKERHKGEKDLLHEDRRIRIAFTSNSSFEPVIANMVLHFGTPVNILHADTRDVKGVARGQMILGLPEDKELQEEMISWLISRGLAVEEVNSDVEQ